MKYSVVFEGQLLPKKMLKFSFLITFVWLSRKLSLNYLQYDESASELYKEEGSKRRKSRKCENDVRPLSKNDINNIRRSQVCTKAYWVWNLCCNVISRLLDNLLLHHHFHRMYQKIVIFTENCQYNLYPVIFLSSNS